MDGHSGFYKDKLDIFFLVVFFPVSFVIVPVIEDAFPTIGFY